MGIQTNWGLDKVELPVVDDDPFADLEEIGPVIDLSLGEAGIHRRLRWEMEREAAMWDKGISCDVKAEDARGCGSGCPLYTTNPQERMYSLCFLSVQQKRMLEALETLRAEQTPEPVS